MLALNRQIRMEAMSILFGTNTFHFENSTTMEHFLKGLSVESLLLIETFSISMAPRAPGLWDAALQDTGELAGLQLKKLIIQLKTDEEEISEAKRVDSWINMRYGPAFNNLDELGVQIVCYKKAFLAILSLSPEVRDVIEKADKALWDGLVPKMLKQVEGQPHTGPELLHQRMDLRHEMFSPCPDDDV